MNRRFIAGAVCQHCGIEDRIVLVTNGEMKVFECVSCGYSENINHLNSSQDQAQRATDDIHSTPIQWVPDNE